MPDLDRGIIRHEQSRRTDKDGISSRLGHFGDQPIGSDFRSHPFHPIDFFGDLMAALAGLQALAYGTYDDLCRHCVDCGLVLRPIACRRKIERRGSQPLCTASIAEWRSACSSGPAYRSASGACHSSGLAQPVQFASEAGPKGIPRPLGGPPLLRGPADPAGPPGPCAQRRLRARCSRPCSYDL